MYFCFDQVLNVCIPFIFLLKYGTNKWAICQFQIDFEKMYVIIYILKYVDKVKDKLWFLNWSTNTFCQI